MNNVRRKLLKPKNDKKTTDENTTRSDGISLAMGSPEYQELINDNKGLNEFEQSNERLAKAGLKKPMLKKKRSWHDERLSELEEYPEKLSINARKLPKQAYNQRQSRQALKQSEIEEMTAKATAMAAKTPSEKDDKAVKRRLPQVLEDGVYNDGVSVDDYMPGSKTLNKFID